MTGRPNELTAVEAARRIDAGELTVEALVRACLERIEEREPDIAAFAHLDREEVLAAAVAHDGAGAMHGVPVGVKDIVDTVDAPTTYGSPIYRDHWPGMDAVCVNRIHAAGGIVLGKTVTTEFAARYPGRTRNPHDVRHSPGGSSSGSAAAVADCMLPLGIGTQTAGSVIRPASFCGVYGYKATFGLLSFAGIRHYAESVDTLGCMARSVEDLAFFRDVLLGVEPAPLEPFPGRPRLGLCRTHHWEEAEEATRACLEDGARRLAAAGMDVEDVDLPAGMEDSLEVYNRVQQFEGARCIGPDFDSHPDLLSVDARALHELGMAVEAASYREAIRRHYEWRARVDEAFAGFDAVLTPSAAGEAPRGLRFTGDIAFNYLWTALHLPAVTIPAFEGPQGLPIGLQLVAPRHADDRLLGVAALVARHLA